MWHKEGRVMNDYEKNGHLNSQLLLLIYLIIFILKSGSAVVTRENGDGLALGRLASVIEQISELHYQGKQVWN